MLEIQDTRDLSKIFLVYRGGSSFDFLAALARKVLRLHSHSNPCHWMGEPQEIAAIPCFPISVSPSSIAASSNIHTLILFSMWESLPQNPVCSDNPLE